MTYPREDGGPGQLRQVFLEPALKFEIFVTYEYSIGT